MAAGCLGERLTMSRRIVAFGELLIRLTPPNRQLLVQSPGLDWFVGGAEANAAVGLATLGHEVSFVGAVSSNTLGDRVISSLRAAGIDTRHLVRAPGRMGLYFMETGSGPRPSSILYDRAGSAFAELDPDLIPFDAAIAGAAVFHCGGITPALGPNGVRLAQRAVASACKFGVPICFDGNYRAQLWSSWASDPQRELRALVEQATILIGNHRDISLLLGKAFSGEGVERRRAAALAAFDEFPNLQLIASTARSLVTADHHQISARVDTRDASFQTPEIDITGIVERIGSGDAFAAGILHGWVNGCDLRGMAESGLALTALKHSIPGDLCVIGRAELDAFSASVGDVRR